jgi:two-component system phosphate regulon sensor histidine kinase PhoR
VSILGESRDTGQPADGELQFDSPTGPRVLVRTRPLSGNQGLVAAFVDVTDLRRLENLRREFVANASHELRTPIASIQSAVETLTGPGAHDPKARDMFLAIIQRNSERLRLLVEDMLDLSRIESREFKIWLQPVSPAVVVAQVFDSLAGAAKKKNIQLVSEVPDSLLLSSDHRALEQVLQNLIENAIKYCPEGSVVRLAGVEDGPQSCLEVSDNGPGIAKEHLPRLFERFYRVDAGRSRQVGGTGLGLAIVKHLVEAMGGTVGVKSGEGKGTTFTVCLKIA